MAAADDSTLQQDVSSSAPHAEWVREYESFWLDAIRLAAGGEVPRPTLATAQKLRLLFGGRSAEGTAGE